MGGGTSKAAARQAEEERQAEEIAAADEAAAAELQFAFERQQQAAAEEEARRQAKHDAFIAALDQADLERGVAPRMRRKFSHHSQMASTLKPLPRQPKCILSDSIAGKAALEAAAAILSKREGVGAQEHVPRGRQECSAMVLELELGHPPAGSAMSELQSVVESGMDCCQLYGWQLVRVRLLRAGRICVVVTQADAESLLDALPREISIASVGALATHHGTLNGYLSYGYISTQLQLISHLDGNRAQLVPCTDFIQARDNCIELQLPAGDHVVALRTHTNMNVAELMGLEALGEAQGRGRAQSIERRLVGVAVHNEDGSGNSGEEASAVILEALDWKDGWGLVSPWLVDRAVLHGKKLPFGATPEEMDGYAHEEELERAVTDEDYGFRREEAARQELRLWEGRAASGLATDILCLHWKNPSKFCLVHEQLRLILAGMEVVTTIGGARTGERVRQADTGIVGVQIDVTLEPGDSATVVVSADVHGVPGVSDWVMERDVELSHAPRLLGP